MKIKKEDWNYAAGVADGMSKGSNKPIKLKNKYKFKGDASSLSGMGRSYYEDKQMLKKQKYETLIPAESNVPPQYQEAEVTILYNISPGEKSSSSYPGSGATLDMQVMFKNQDITDKLPEETLQKLETEILSKDTHNEEIIPVSKMLTTFLEDMEALREDGAALTFTPEEIKKIAKVKPEGLEFQISNSKQEITFAAGAHNAEEEVTFTKTANGIRKTDANGEVDYDDVAELVDAFSGIEQQQEGKLSGVTSGPENTKKNSSGVTKPGQTTPQEKAAFMRHRNASKIVPDKSKLSDDEARDPKKIKQLQDDYKLIARAATEGSKDSQQHYNTTFMHDIINIAKQYEKEYVRSEEVSLGADRSMDSAQPAEEELRDGGVNNPTE